MGGFEWIIIVIAVIGGLARFLGKARTGTEQPQRQELKRPEVLTADPEPTEPQYIDFTEDHGWDSESAGSYEGSRPLYEEEGEKPYERETEQPYERETEHPFERETYEAYKRETVRPYKKNRDKHSHPFRHLTKEQLREGIVLAEILSERPRSLNPHPAARRYRRIKG